MLKRLQSMNSLEFEIGIFRYSMKRSENNYYVIDRFLFPPTISISTRVEQFNL